MTTDLIMTLGYISAYLILCCLSICSLVGIFWGLRKLFHRRYDAYVMALIAVQFFPTITEERLENIYEIAKQKIEKLTTKTADPIDTNKGE